MEADLVPEKNGIEDGAPTEQDVMHKVVQMVNDALSADKNEKQKKLGEVYEIVFQQHPSLIPKILPDFLSFHQDSEPSIRKFVRHVIDEAIKLSHESLPDVLLSHCKDILIWFVSQDKNICASKKALQLAIRVWLRIRFTHIGPAEEMVRGFLDLLKEDEKLSQRDVLRLYVIKFLEVAVLNDTAANATTFLRLMGEHLLPLSQTSSLQPMCQVVAILQSFSMIGVSIPHHIPTILEGMGGLYRMMHRPTSQQFKQQKKKGSYSTHQIRLIRHAMRATTTRLSKIRDLPLPVGNRISMFLSDLAKPPPQPISGTKKRKELGEKRDGVSDERPSKRPRMEEDDQHNKAVKEEVLAMVAAQSSFYQNEKRSTPPIILQFILERMSLYSSSLSSTSSSLQQQQQELSSPLPSIELELSPLELKEQGIKSFSRILDLRPDRSNVNCVFFRRGMLIRLAQIKRAKIDCVGDSDVDKKTEDGDVEMSERTQNGKEEESIDQFDENDGKTGDAVLKYLLEQPWGRKELFLQWLYRLLAVCLSSCSSCLDEEQFYKTGCDQYNFILIEYLKQTLAKRKPLDIGKSNEEEEEEEENSLSLSSSSESDANLLSQEVVLNIFLKVVEEAPLLPSAFFKYLEDVCLQQDTLDIGLPTLEKAILCRSYHPYREESLKILLNFTCHKEPTVRQMAIEVACQSLVHLKKPTSKKQPSSKIQRFACEMLKSLIKQFANQSSSSESSSETEKKIEEEESKEEKIEMKREEDDESETPMEDAPNPSIPQRPSAEQEVNRRVPLYFALVKEGKLPGGLHDLLVTFSQVPVEVKKLLYQACAQVIRSTPLSEETILSAIVDVPDGSEAFVRPFLQLVAESTPDWPPKVIQEVRNLYQRKEKDVRFLVPIICYLTKEEIEEFIPTAMGQLPLETLIVATARLLNSKNPPVTASHLLCQLVVAAEGDRVNKCMKVINFCLDQTEIFPWETVAAVLQQLIDVSPWPYLFMRLVFQATEKFPNGLGYINRLLSRKKVWTDARLWPGFAKFCKRTYPHSMGLMAQLPDDKVEDILKKYPELCEPFCKYCEVNGVSRNMDPIRALIPQKSKK